MLKLRALVPGTATLTAMFLLGCAPPPTGAKAADERRSDDDVTFSDTTSGKGGPAAPPVIPGAPAGAVGLAVEVDSGAGIPLTLRAGQTFWLNQIDIRAAIETNVDEGVDGLAHSGDFASLPWAGVRNVDTEPEDLPNSDGTWTRRAFYREAPWMEVQSYFSLQQVDAAGHNIGAALLVSAGDDNTRRDCDDFFVRRMRAIQWANDCASPTDCSAATSFQEEALVELRNSMSPSNTFKLDPRTAAFKLGWTLKAGSWTIPVTQVKTPQYDYGFSIDLNALTAPRHDGTYAPGTAIQFQVTLRDGSGNRLHPVGSLPKYLDVINGVDTSGIQYYRAFFDPTVTYYRRKHRERQLLADFMGPAQNIQPIRSEVQVATVLGPNDTDPVASIAVDGVYGELRAFPTGNKLFGGAFDPTHAGWFDPVPDNWFFHVPSDAPAGTYYATIKGRRTFMGEDIPYTRTVPIQVGTRTVTTPTLATGGCQSCHTGDSSFQAILHANADRGTCNACHAPLAFEYEGPIYVRTHFIHSRSQRFDQPTTQCSNCHLTNASIQRTSKSACLSCHKSYPDSHVQQYGAITSVFIGGGPSDSFNQCTSSCHRSHPGSGL